MKTTDDLDSFFEEENKRINWKYIPIILILVFCAGLCARMYYNSDQELQRLNAEMRLDKEADSLMKISSDDSKSIAVRRNAFEDALALNPNRPEASHAEFYRAYFDRLEADSMLRNTQRNESEESMEDQKNLQALAALCSLQGEHEAYVKAGKKKAAAECQRKMDSIRASRPHKKLRQIDFDMNDLSRTKSVYGI